LAGSLAGVLNPENQQLILADVNGNGTLNAGDSTVATLSFGARLGSLPDDIVGLRTGAFSSQTGQTGIIHLSSFSECRL